MNERFTDLADHISETVGKWWFTVFSLVALAAWALYGALGIAPRVDHWFTSNEWNFPLNTITTVGEWFLEGLVLAAANRSERRNRELLDALLQFARREQVELGQIERELEGEH